MQVQSVNLTDISPGEQSPVEFAGQPRLVVYDHHPSVQLRINDRTGDALDAVRGDEFCTEEGIGKVYVENPDQVEATLRLLVLEMDETLEAGLDPASVRGGAPPTPLRLTGDLAAGTIIDPGQELTATADIHPADAARIRAKVSGISSLTEEQRQSEDAGAGLITALDRERSYAYALTGQAEIRTFGWDPSGDSLTALNTANISNLNQDQQAIAYDPNQQLLHLVGVDGADGNQYYEVVDMADPVNPTVTDTFQIATSGWFASVSPHESQQVAYISTRADGGTIYAVDYSTPGTLAQVTTNDNVKWQHSALDQSASVLFATDQTNDATVIFDVSGQTLTPVASVPVDTSQDWVDGAFSEPTLDTDRKIAAVVVSNDSNLVHFIDYSDPGSPVLAFFEGETGIGQIDSRKAHDMGLSTGIYYPSYSDIRRVDYRNLEPVALSVLTNPRGVNLPRLEIDARGDRDWLVSTNDPAAARWSNSGKYEVAVVPMLTDGTLSASGPVVRGTFRDDVEGLLDHQDIIGENPVQVQVTNRASQQGAIDFVEVYHG